MRLQTNLVRRGTGFYYRARVPEDLKKHYGKSEFSPKPNKVKSPTIEHLIEYWMSQSEKRPRTLMEAHTARKRLQAIVGSDLAALIEKHHVIALKDQQLAKGLAPATIQKQANLLRAVFEVAVSMGVIKINRRCSRHELLRWFLPDF